MTPPKCKTCGVAEWHHTCGPRAEMSKLLVAEMATHPGLKISLQAVKTIEKHLNQKPKTDRKEYLKLKARERRARQKAAK